MKPRREPPLKRPHSSDDEWSESTRTTCARSIAAWLKESINTARPINTLKLPELEMMAEAAVSTWIVAASKRIPEAPDSPKTREMRGLLYRV